MPRNDLLDLLAAIASQASGAADTYWNQGVLELRDDVAALCSMLGELEPHRRRLDEEIAGRTSRGGA